MGEIVTVATTRLKKFLAENIFFKSYLRANHQQSDVQEVGKCALKLNLAKACFWNTFSVTRRMTRS